MTKKKEETFESLLSNMQAILNKMEDPATSVDECTKLFEQGVLISKECKQKLDQANGKIIQLQGELDNLQSKDFNVDKN